MIAIPHHHEPPENMTTKNRKNLRPLEQIVIDDFELDLIAHKNGQPVNLYLEHGTASISPRLECNLRKLTLRRSAA
jgi:hypothetical protein